MRKLWRRLGWGARISLAVIAAYFAVALRLTRMELSRQFQTPQLTTLKKQKPTKKTVGSSKLQII